MSVEKLFKVALPKASRRFRSSEASHQRDWLRN